MLIVRPVHGDALAAFDDTFDLLGTIFALLLCWGAPQWSRTIFPAWRRSQSVPVFGRTPTWIGLGFLGQAIAGIITAGYGAWSGAVPFPSLADAFYLASYPCMLIGILLMPMRPLPSVARLRLSLDGILIVVGVATVGWYFLLGPAILQSSAASSSLWEKVIGGSYPVGDVLLGACLLLLWIRAGDRTIRSSILLVSVGVALVTVADRVFIYQQIHGTYTAGALIDPMWALASLLIGVGVAEVRLAGFGTIVAAAEDSARDVPPLALWRSLIPYALVPIIGFLLVHSLLVPTDRTIQAGVIAGAIALLGLIFFRQFLAIRELHTLYSRNNALSEANVQEQAQAQMAEDLARLRGDFVASVSHELRTPLTAIVGYAELLEARWSTTTEAARLKYVRRIVWSANRQMRLVQDLLLVSRLDVGALSVECLPTDLSTQVQLAVTELQGSYQGQQIEIHGPPGVQVHADAARVTQILVNLLDNAAKYSPEGSPVTVSWTLRPLETQVRVRDQGPGMPLEGRERLFTRFGRLPGSPIRAGRVGTGLGLFLGRQLARAMGGDLELEDTGPQGSTFCLRLPLAISRPLARDSQRHHGVVAS